MSGRFFASVTVLSRGADESVWYPTVLPDVFLRRTDGDALTTGGPEPSGGLTLRIPVRGGRRSREEFSAAEDKTGLFTLLPGDYIIPEPVETEVISGEPRKQFPEARRIKAVVARLYGSHLDHWEVETS
nr:MAG TPA: hypothetical protein [Caudoviricetes sp.]